MTNHAAAFSINTYPNLTLIPADCLPQFYSFPVLNLRKPAQAPLTSAVPEYKDP